jgi:glycosyltransferase involved in cell wall biosynthesis
MTVPLMPSLCHIVPTFTIGGREVRMVAILNGLELVARHTVLTLDGRAEAAALLNGGASVTVEGGTDFSGAKAVPRLIRYVRRARPDLLLTYNWGAMDAVLAGLVARVCPVIHMEDGFGSDEARRLKARRVLARRILLNRAFATVVPSRTLHRVCIDDFRLAPERVRYIPNGIDVSQFVPSRSREVLRAFGVPSDGIVFGTVGRLRREKNLGLLLDAFDRADIDKGWLVVVGDGECREELAARAATLGRSRRVVFAGASTDPRPFYAAFDVFVMSSSTEQMPLVLLEAMASGLPAVCTKVGDCAEVLGNQAVSQVVAPGDGAALARALRHLAENASERAALGSGNRERCVAGFSLDVMLSRYAALYREAIDSADERGPRL